MSANDIYIIKEECRTSPDRLEYFVVYHCDVDDEGPGKVVGWWPTLREAVAVAEGGNAEYNYRIEFLAKGA